MVFATGLRFTSTGSWGTGATTVAATVVDAVAAGTTAAAAAAAVDGCGCWEVTAVMYSVCCDCVRVRLLCKSFRYYLFNIFLDILF